MPELPEVETVRAGLETHVLGHRIVSVQVLHPRAIRRHVAGAEDFVRDLTGRHIRGARRRGKYLWLDLSEPGDAVTHDVDPAPVGATCLLTHLGMSGQLLIGPGEDKHLRVRLGLLAADGTATDLRFVDQRTFGGLSTDRLVACPDVAVGDVAALDVDTVPALVAHIARDPMDRRFDDALWSARLRSRRSEVKRTLLDQSLVSGIGNIYADESLWRAKVHGARAADSLSRASARSILAAVREVMGAALLAGGTSFDALYVNVNGQSGYFDRSLAVYGQQGRACPRCGTAIRRTPFMNRSSFWCPRCQRAPS